MKNRFTQKDLAAAGFEDRERGPEAEARHLAYVQNAYATLSTTSELLARGAQAGLQVGAALLAIETAILIAIIAAAFSVNEGGFANLYGPTPLSGTFLEPLWPILLSLPVLPAFVVIGAIAALMRRAGSRKRRVLYKYFSPASPRFDFVTFCISVFGLLILGAWAWGLFSTGIDPTGVITIALCFSGLLAWVSHKMWLFWYLPLIHKHGSASMDEIRELIARQL